MKRYNNRIRIKDESIAEHSFFVAYNILKVGYDYKLPAEVINEAVSMAIAHDFPELSEQYEKLVKNDSLAALLVELGDAISVLQYTNREISLGNKTDDMAIIHNEVCCRVTQLFARLDGYKLPKGITTDPSH